MNSWRRLRRSNFFIKLRSWEYWPFGILQAPVFVYWALLVIRTRSLFYFSASNPGILAGGMLGESKSDVLDLVPDDVKPKTFLIKLPSSVDDVKLQIAAHGLQLPVIFKPDLGERGWMVRRIKSDDEIRKYLEEIKIDFIIQELVNYPLEFGVFYVRFPNEENGRVNSITMKRFLSVVGDGRSTLEELIMNVDRAKLQWDSLKEAHKKDLQRVLDKGEEVELVSIGNHCLGTTFLNANHLITPALNDSFNKISKQIPGFYFGRYDLRCKSLEDLEAGRVQIVELNGCGAEPAHIYHPGASFWKGMATLFVHFHNMYRISAINHSMGVPYLSFREGHSIYKKFKALRAGS